MRTKYVLIERGEGFKNTYTTRKVAEHGLAAGTIQSFRPVTKAEIKTLNAHHYKENDYFRHIAEADFIKEHNERKCKATIISNVTRGEMLVKVEGLDHLQVIYACNIKGAKTWYPETACVYYKKGEVVDVELKVYHDFKVFVCGLTPGHLDTEHWERIKDEPLAFRCDENGKAITGLFK
jgi:hypothetical protein